MITRKVRSLAYGVGAIGLLGSAVAAQAGPNDCNVPDNNTPVTTCYFDLTQAGSSSPNPPGPAPVLLNGGIFSVPAGDTTIVGTGVFDPFIRIQEPGNGSKASDGIEEGFNTDFNGPGSGLILDNHNFGAHNWNHSVKLGEVATVTIDGVEYLQFVLDVNEQGNAANAKISLDDFKLFFANSGALYQNSSDGSGSCGTDADPAGDFKLCSATEAYDMDGSQGGDTTILLDYRNYSGSGKGIDLNVLVPKANFTGKGATSDSYLYLYSKFGVTGTNCNVTGSKVSPCQTPNGPLAAGSFGNYGVDAGFEEWSFRRSSVPVPGTVLLLAIGLVAVSRFRAKGQTASV